MRGGEFAPPASAFAPPTGGAPVQPPFFGPGPPIQTTKTDHGPFGCNLFVFHIPNDLTNLDLYTLFSQFGVVISVRIMVEKASGRSRGFGFVSYEERNAAEFAIQSMNGFQIGHKRLKVQHKNEKPDPTRPEFGGNAGGGRGRNGSRGGGGGGIAGARAEMMMMMQMQDARLAEEWQQQQQQQAPRFPYDLPAPPPSSVAAPQPVLVVDAHVCPPQPHPSLAPAPRPFSSSSAFAPSTSPPSPTYAREWDDDGGVGAAAAGGWAPHHDLPEAHVALDQFAAPSRSHPSGVFYDPAGGKMADPAGGDVLLSSVLSDLAGGKAAPPGGASSPVLGGRSGAGSPEQDEWWRTALCAERPVQV